MAACNKTMALRSVLRFFSICLLILIVLQVGGSEAGKKNNKTKQRWTFSSRMHELSRRRHRGHMHRGGSPQKTNYKPKPQTLHSLGRDYASRAGYASFPFQYPFRRPQRHHQNKNARTEVIHDAVLTLPGLSQLLDPAATQPDYNYLQGTVRKKRLYCRVGIGFHLEIKANGRVQANHRTSPDGILEIFSVGTGVVGIRSSRRRQYLCMNKAGSVFTRKNFRPDCSFRENLEGNNFNTYASQQYSDPKTRKGYYLAITKRGRIPKRMKKVSWKQKRAHWLPRMV